MSKILIIDDENTLREEIVEWLLLEGFEAFGACDGIEGVEMAIHHQPDLILCDINMPRLDGYGVLLEVHSNPATAFTPFIFLSARATHAEIRKGMELGADDYLTKPFRHSELMQAIDTRLKKKAEQDDEHQQQVELLQQLLTHEREQRLLKAKLVAMYSHDFRNPLLGIITSVQFMRHYGDMSDSSRSAAHMDRVEASAHQLLQMLDNMLLISQMETGKLRPRFVPLNLGTFFQEIVGEFQAIYGETHVITYSNHLGRTVMADSRLLRHIASNLISNAIKYSPQGGEVKICLDVQPDNYLFSVQDHGIGIPESDLAQLFEPFHRAGNVGAISGTGLGLTITKESVELHGGTISIESQVGAGTTFTIHIPLSPRT